MRLPHPPVHLEGILPDAWMIWDLAREHAPYSPVQRYFANRQEQEALSDAGKDSETGKPDSTPQDLVVAPVFRGDWAYDKPLVQGVEPLLGNSRFVDGAKKVFGGAIVRPQMVYINLTAPLPTYDTGHTDIPAFRGVDRTRYPVWLLVTMVRSGLFEEWRIPIATAVSWWYEGEGGGFTYWPHGPDAAPRSVPATTNTAVVGDNDFMFHRVERTGPKGSPWIRGMTLDSLLNAEEDGGWSITNGDSELARFSEEEIRISVSWKAQVFQNEAQQRAVDEHVNDLTLEQVWELFADDLETRGVPFALPEDPLHDVEFMKVLSETYHRTPTVYESA